MNTLLLKAELIKLRRNKLWLMIVMFAVLSTAIPFCLFYYQNGGTEGWRDLILWGHAFAPFFLYTFTALFFYLIVSSEYNGLTWKVILTEPIKRKGILLSKWLIVNIALFISLCLSAFFLGVAAYLLQLSFSLLDLLFYLFTLWLSSQAMVSILLVMSVKIANGNLVIGIGILSSLAYLFYNEQKWLPTSFPGWVVQEQGYSLEGALSFTLISVLLGGLIIFFTMKNFSKHEF
ncbi:ABC transporter permease [Halalkalibacter alkalisediminis]|uniref:ABC transporter permease n=1 Tax=Halalkalibacter alkalisediminis TaxID=935616 RepID=A0ABV6NL46_9BACI|nr:ABC transporter permease [Halalkalibacter alkalisediminis]